MGGGHLGGNLTYGEGYLTELIFAPKERNKAGEIRATPAVAVGQWLWTRRAGKNDELTEANDSPVTESEYPTTKGA